MIRRGRKRKGEDGSLAFLDIVSCSFGAVVLLLLIVKTVAPEDESARQLAAASQSELEAMEERLKRRRELLAALTRQASESGKGRMAEDKLKGKLRAALQALDEEMRMLELKPDDAKVGGIPADSRYIIFIVDTSGSMQMYAWHKVVEQMTAILDVYPQVEGIQVMSDMGEYLYTGYRGRWLQDTAKRRARILRDVKSWGALSNSDPIEGILAAIQQYAGKTRHLSLYVLGDDFSGSVQKLLEQVDLLNRGAGRGHKVRIHAIGFRTPGLQQGRLGYLHFARLSELTRRNGGTFIGISTR